MAALTVTMAAAALLLLPSVASAAECTDTWTEVAGTGWGTAASWSTGKVPTESDVACIPSGLAVSTQGFGTVKAGVVQGEGIILINGGGLDVSSTEAPSQIANVTMGVGGYLTGAGEVVIGKSLTWGGESYMEGTGSTVVESGATVTTSAGGSHIIKGTRRFINEGTYTQTKGGLELLEGAAFINRGIFYADTSTRTNSVEGSAVFTNEGALLHRTSEPGGISSPLVNAGGGVAAQAGTFTISGLSSSSGSAHWESQGSAVLVFSGASVGLGSGAATGKLRINGGSTVSTAEGMNAEGTEIEIVGATASFPGVLSIGTLTIGTGGHLTGAGEVLIENGLAWGGEGYLEGSGTTVVQLGATVTTPAGGSHIIKGTRRFINEGTYTQTKGGLELLEFAEFVNRGIFTADTSSREDAVSSGGQGIFVNRLTFQKTTGSETTEISAPFENFGEIRELSGHLRFTHRVSANASDDSPFHCEHGDPVDCATGNFTESQSDLAIGGRGVGLDLTRNYSAQAAAAGVGGIFGHGWTNSFGDHLIPGAASEEGGYYYEPLFREAGGGPVTLVESSGSSVPFHKSGGLYSAPGWSQDKLSGSVVTGFTLTLPDQTIEKFSAEGQLETVADRDGNETTLAYNGSGDLETITDPSGRTITLAYNGSGLVESAEDPMGHVVHYTYESGNLKTVRLPGESSPNWTFGYDGSHRMTSMKDGRGGETINEYDGSSRVIVQIDPMKHRTTWEYSSFHTKIDDEATGAVTDERFNSDNQPISVTRGFGTAAATTESFTYTGVGLLASATDGNGHKTTYGYDGQGDRTSESDAEGDEAKWTYNGAHQLLTETTPSGEKTTIVRDANGNPETVSRPAPESKTETIEFAYGAYGEVEELTNPLGATWSYEYDSQGDATAAIDPEGDKRTWAYDEDSQVISTVSPRGNKEGAEASKFRTIVERDPQGRPEEIIEPLGGTTEYAYDANGNVESIVDPNGHKTEYTYDAENEPTKVERASGAVEETGYDAAGQVIRQIDGNEDEMTYVRNVLEQPIETIDPLKRKTSRTFDAAGNLVTLEDPDGRTTTYGYDKANRLTGISYSDGITPDVTFGYDEDGNLTDMVDGTGTSTYEYDQLDRLTRSEDGNGEIVGWEYNRGDQPVGLTYPNGKSISRRFDKVGRLESVTDWLGHTTTFGYDADSAPILTTFPVGTTDADEYSYDRADRMSAATMKKGTETLASIAYTRDPAGQVESLISLGLPGAEAESFEYDEDERLSKAGVAEYGYDAADNPTEAPGTTSVFDKAGQLESTTGANFAYDKEGERIERSPSSGPATTYKYDQAGRLIAIERAEEGETPGIAESFGYDGSGLLASRTVGLSTRHLVWDLSESPEQLLSDGENSYVYGPGGLAFEQISSGEVPTYLHHDQIGSTRLLTNGSGATVGTFTYAPFGGMLGKTGATGTALGYDGQYTLGQSGLQYLRARFYDPSTVQFLTVDPAVSATREPFTYGGSNPLNFKDPTGLSFAEDFPGIGIPCLYCEAVQGVEELIEPAWNGGVSAGAWVLKNSLGFTRLDESADQGEASDADCEGRELVRKGEELLGRGHGKAARDRFNEWWRDLGRREKGLYNDRRGPKPRKGG